MSLNEAAQLKGQVSDDGLPEGELSVAWQRLDGPGTVVFEDAAAALTTARFSVSGNYALQLSASDGALSSSDILDVTVTESGLPRAISISPTTASLEPGSSLSFTASVEGGGEVVWSASGGAVQGEGETVNYTAPLEEDSYILNVSLKDDPATSAAAQIEVAAAPEVTLSLSPTSAELLTGQSQMFEVVVTGTVQTDVTWTASGGTVEGAGDSVTYTAPESAGEYRLTATSVADTSRRASASITVSKPNPPGPFSIVALPDTQNYVKDGLREEIFRAQTQWIVDNLDEQNIAFVTHKGDVVDNASSQAEWQFADAALDRLDGQVPYAVAMGDHDYYPEEFHDGQVSNYKQYFGANRYGSYDWYGGNSPNGLSHYQIFEAGGFTFLHLALEWEAPSAALKWAKSVMEANPLPTILTTHAYLWDNYNRGAGHSTLQEACEKDGSTDLSCGDPGDAADASTGAEIFEALVKPYPQIFMVLGGHYHWSGRRSPNPNVSGCDETSSSDDHLLKCDNGEYHQISTNGAGSEVYEMLANYQSYANGGDGWLRILEFIPGGGSGGLDRIKVKTYSPTRDELQTGSASSFSFDFDFSERFTVSR